MNRTIRAAMGVTFVLIIVFCAVIISQNIGRAWKIDVTGQKLYTLSDGSRAILGKLNQPIKIKLYYAKTAAMKGPDQIRFFNNYYQFVRSLLDEYVRAAKGMVELEVIDPRPFSDEEMDAMRYGLKKFSITQEENFFFGLVVQTQFGVEKSIPIFSPNRQKFVEYDISYLIDSAITRKKTKIGVLSSLPIMGDDLSGYMAQMMLMQGQKPKPAWMFIDHLKSKYEVKTIATDTDGINDIDILLVIHPRELKDETIFAIDQFILKGGRTIICVDPYCMAASANQKPMMGQQPPQNQSSNLAVLLHEWGLNMPQLMFAGDRNLAIVAALGNQRAEPIIGFLELEPGCFAVDDPVTAQLNQVRVVFAGVLEEIQAGDTDTKITKTPLLMTTNRGNKWKVDNVLELRMPRPSELMKKFTDGTEPVTMGYLVTGLLSSAFPDGIKVEAEQPEGDKKDGTETEKKTITGLKQAQQDCAVVVLSDVDFLYDQVAYNKTLFGNTVVGDNSAVIFNAIECLSGSGDLISIRSRGNFDRPFLVVDEIERQAERETAEEEAKINAEIAGFEKELQDIFSSAKAGEEELIESAIMQKKKQVELNMHLARQQLREVNKKSRQKTEQLGIKLRFANMFPAPFAVLVVAMGLGIYRSVRKRHYKKSNR